MHRFAVSAVLIGESKIVAADPIIFSAARIDSFDDGFAVVAFSHARRAPAFNFVFWDRGNIHIEKCFWRNAALGDALDQGGGELRSRAEIKVLECNQGNRDRGNTQQRAFDGGGDRAGVNDVVA